MVMRFDSYGALDAFLWTNKKVIVKCWPELNGEWVAEFKI
jgi:hypothetical protein